jgi:hypothetical protein
MKWEKIRPYYFPLEVPNWSPRQILSETEEAALFRKVAGYPEAELAYCVAAITNNTTASGIEVRCLKLENVYLRPAGEIFEIYIPPEACKNDHRTRKIALNDVAQWGRQQNIPARDQAWLHNAPTLPVSVPQKARQVRSDETCDALVSPLFLEPSSGPVRLQ